MSKTATKKSASVAGMLRSHKWFHGLTPKQREQHYANLEAIRTLWADLLKAQSDALLKAREIGLKLAEVKATLPRGDFGQWVEANFPFTERHARNMIRIHDKWKDIEAERAKTPGLSLRAALHLLARANRRAAGQDPDKPQPKKKRKKAQQPRLEVNRQHAANVAKTFGFDPDRALEYLAAVGGKSVVISEGGNAVSETKRRTP